MKKIGKLIIRENGHKTVIINDPRKAARYMKRTMIMVAPSKLDCAMSKAQAFLRTVQGKITASAVLALIAGGGVAITIWQRVRSRKLKRICQTIIRETADSVEDKLTGTESFNEFMALLTIEIMHNQHYIDAENEDKIVIYKLICKILDESWIDNKCDCGDCGLDDYDLSHCSLDDFDEFDDDDDADVVEPAMATPEEVGEDTTVEVKSETPVDRFNRRLNKTKEIRGE